MSVKPTDHPPEYPCDALHLQNESILVFEDAQRGEWIEIDVEHCIDQQVWC